MYIISRAKNNIVSANPMIKVNARNCPNSTNNAINIVCTKIATLNHFEFPGFYSGPKTH